MKVTKMYFPLRLKWDCPEGPKITFVNIEKSFPNWLKEFNTKIKMDLKQLRDLNLEADVKTKIKELENIYDKYDLIAQYYIIYSAYQNSPCTNEDYFQRRVDHLLDSHKIIMAKREKIRGFIEFSLTNPSNPQLIEMCQRVFESDISSKATTCIQETREIMDDAIGGDPWARK